MHAVLSIPAWWQEDKRSAPLRDSQVLAELGRQISRSLRPSMLLYAALPPDIPVTVEWIRDDVNPRTAEPALLVVAEGAAQNPQRESVSQAALRLARAMSDSHLATIAPDCTVRLRVVTEHAAPLGG